MHTQFIMLYTAHSVVNGDDELMCDITAVVENEVTKRTHPH
jgi:hypothetical protein